MKYKVLWGLLAFCCCIVAQAQVRDSLTTKSNLFTFSPSKLLTKGQWDIKWFNNLYTEVRGADKSGAKSDRIRQNFFTSSLDVFTGINDSKTINVGLSIEYRSNTINGMDALSVFEFKNNPTQFSRSGITSIAPSIKFSPIKQVSNFTMQSAFHIPLISKEVLSGVFLDQKGFIWQNKFFYDYIADNEQIQIFAEIKTLYSFGKKESSYANDSLGVAPGIFVSYFPTQNFTILGLVQHYNLIAINNGFSQNYTAVGAGAKYQLTRAINFEVIYTNFVRGNDTGLGQTFNFGLRALLD
jgi:hypothetical protein